MALGMVRALGWLVIAHGVSHAVLPLRGSLGPAMLIDDWVPVGLYAIGMVGFLAAGLGLLGLRPLDRAISPLLVLASGLSLVAIVRFADPTLWFGAACDAILLLLGLWRGYGGWPVHPSHGRLWHAAGLTAGFALLAYVSVATVLFPWHRTWGSTRDELLMALPGDPAQRDIALETQHAITIDAPVETVWPELRTRLAQRGDARVLEPEHAVVVQGVGAYVLRDAGGRSRLIVRSTIGDERIPVWASALRILRELPSFLRERRFLLSLKQVAESRRAARVLAAS